MLQVTVNNVGDVFSRLLHIVTHISLGFFPEVVQKQTLSEVKTKWPFNGKLCQKYSHQKL